ncbi:hypothetical protein RHGRI_002095 [Rhododendron griersonianum]|uniref:Hyccin n=1 Tax=Rhododendron griersonianum TaxID=479676 RepID=A0AAV6LNH2_9ERIC|nr:hypothetical protein RHGRI_002095 [Rhododendron griersonianum]
MDTTLDPPSTSEPTTPTPSPSPSPTTHEDLNSLKKAQLSLHSLSQILPHNTTSLPPSLLSSNNPAFSLLHSPSLSSEISSLLRHPSSGSPDNHLCRWLYDTFHSSDPTLQLLVLRFVPTLAGLYLSRAVNPRKPPLAGFEAVLLALYAHETANRNGQSVTVCIPDLSHSSIYHESTAAAARKEGGGATELNLTVVSGSLDPHGTVRSTRRGRIVGVALELYYSKICQMPVDSKVEFCEFCRVWAGQDGDMYKDGAEVDNESADQQSEPSDEGIKEESGGKEEGRIPLPWELLQPALRILGHCIMGPNINKEDKALHEAAFGACRSLYARSMHDVNPKAILATGSLLRLGKMAVDSSNDNDGFDPTELPQDNVLTL